MRHAALTIELEVQMVPTGGVEPPPPDLQSSALPLSYDGMAESQGDCVTPAACEP